MTTTYLGSTTGLRRRGVQPTGRLELNAKTADRSASSWVGRATRTFADVDIAAAYAEARPLVTDTPGFRSIRMTRGVESPSRFVLLVEWDSVAAHEENFRGSERFPRWRALIGPYFAAPPVVEHFTDVPPATG